MAVYGVCRAAALRKPNFTIYVCCIYLFSVCALTKSQECSVEAGCAEIALLQTGVRHTSADERVAATSVHGQQTATEAAATEAIKSLTAVEEKVADREAAKATKATMDSKVPRDSSKSTMILEQVMQRQSSREAGAALSIIVLVVLVGAVVAVLAFMQGGDRGGRPADSKFATEGPSPSMANVERMKVPPTSRARPSEPVASGPPPLCSSLILVKTEARFLLPLEGLVRPRGDMVHLDIRGTSGSTLMHASMEAGPNGQLLLALFLVNCEHDPRAMIHAVTPTVMEIYGRGKRFYGTLELVSGNNAVVKYEGVPVMTVDRTDSNSLSLTASAMGQVLAVGSTPPPLGPSKGSTTDSDSWGLKVKPGADAILIMSCMLAMMLLQPRMNGRPTMTLPGDGARQSMRSEISAASLVPRTMPSDRSS